MNHEANNSTTNQSIIEELSSIIWPISDSRDLPNEDNFPELSPTTYEFVKNIFLVDSTKVNSLNELISRYNKDCRYLFLRAHLAAIYSLLDELESSKSSQDAKLKIKNKIFGLVNQLSFYKLSEKKHDQVENYYYESLALVQRCFKELCFRFNALYAHNLDELDENLGQIYANLLFDYDEDDENHASTHLVSVANLFSKIHYEVDKQIAISETFQDDSLIVLSLIKQYSARRDFLWRRLFLFCYCENKLLLKTLIDECLLLISRNQFEHLNLVFSVKEFLNLKPLILLLGILLNLFTNNVNNF